MFGHPDFFSCLFTIDIFDIGTRKRFECPKMLNMLMTLHGNIVLTTATIQRRDLNIWTMMDMLIPLLKVIVLMKAAIQRRNLRLQTMRDMLMTLLKVKDKTLCKSSNLKYIIVCTLLRALNINLLLNYIFMGTIGF